MHGAVTVRGTADHPVPVFLVGASGYGRTHRERPRRATAPGRVRAVGTCDPHPLDTVARAGWHVLLEKPSAPVLAALQEPTAGLRSAGPVCRVGFRSFGPHVLAAVRRLTAKGAVGATAAQTASPARTVHIAGDSTAAAKPASAAPMTGWAMALPFFLGPHLAVANHARDGRSTRSFLTEGRLTALLPALRPGDVLLIQFGHNDQKTDDPSRFTDPATGYRHNLLSLVGAARACGARPVLLTPVERRSYDADGRALPTHGAYADAVRALATTEEVPMLDIQAQSLSLWQRLGPEGSKKAFLWLQPGRHPNHPRGVRDDTHLAPWGAAEVARMVARGLRAAGVLSPGDLRRPPDAVPDTWITWPEPPVRKRGQRGNGLVDQ